PAGLTLPYLEKIEVAAVGRLRDGLPEQAVIAPCRGGRPARSDPIPTPGAGRLVPHQIEPPLLPPQPDAVARTPPRPPPAPRPRPPRVPRAARGCRRRCPTCGRRRCAPCP